jgi:hypothetical protein
VSELETGAKAIPKKNLLSVLKKIYQLNEEEMNKTMLAFAQSGRN